MSGIDIGSDIVANAGEPTKTVEEMRELMGVEETSANEGQTPATGDSQTTVKVETPSLESAFQVVPTEQPVKENSSAPTQAAEPEVFDPAIHCTDEFGNPRKNRDGTFRKKPGRKGEKVKEQVKASQYESFTCAAPVSTVHMVQMMLDSATMITAKFLGDEWKMSPDEKAILTDAYSRYIHYKGWDGAMSPEAFVIGVTASYLMPRLLNGGIIEKLLGMGGKNAHANTRQNGERKNNIGESHRPPNGTGGSNRDSARPPTNGMGGTIEISTLRGPSH